MRTAQTYSRNAYQNAGSFIARSSWDAIDNADVALHAVLCGNNGEACWGKYGSYPLHRSYCHEMALRILLASIESHANRYKRHIVPVRALCTGQDMRTSVVYLPVSGKLRRGLPD